MHNLTIVIQGPTDYYKEILLNLSPNQHYIWSTWDDEPKNNLNAIAEKINLVTSIKPSFPCIANVNLQCLSTVRGIESANSEFVFKTRGDMIFSNIDLLMDIIMANNKEMSFIHYGNPPQQVGDFFVFGKKDKSLSFWNHHFTDFGITAPEMRLTNLYKNRIAPNDSFEELMSRFFFFRNHLVPNVNDIYWLKINRWFTSFNGEDNLYPKL